MKLLIVTGSARPTSINQHIVKAVEELVAVRQTIEPSLADVVSLDLPFVNSPAAPSDDDFTITDSRVQAWSDMVRSADAVLFVMPEYNHNMSAIQKNALDWLFREWHDKPVSGVAYSWHNGKYAAAALDGALAVVKARTVEPIAQLQFMEIVDQSGTIVNREAFNQRVNATLDSLLRVTGGN